MTTLKLLAAPLINFLTFLHKVKKPHYRLWPCWHSEDQMVALASWLLCVCYCRNLIPAYSDTAAALGKVFPELNGTLPSMTPPPRHTCQIPSGQKVMEQESARPTNLWFPFASVTGYFLWYLCACLLSHFSQVWLCVTPGTVACQVPLSMAFSRQEYWSASPFTPPGDLPHPGIKPTSLTSPALAGRFFATSATWEVPPLIPKFTNW